MSFSNVVFPLVSHVSHHNVSADLAVMLELWKGVTGFTLLESLVVQAVQPKVSNELHSVLVVSIPFPTGVHKV